jgi:hypothetical protein
VLRLLQHLVQNGAHSVQLQLLLLIAHLMLLELLLLLLLLQHSQHLSAQGGSLRAQQRGCRLRLPGPLQQRHGRSGGRGGRGLLGLLLLSHADDHGGVDLVLHGELLLQSHLLLQQSLRLLFVFAWRHARRESGTGADSGTRTGTGFADRASATERRRWPQNGLSSTAAASQGRRFPTLPLALRQARVRVLGVVFVRVIFLLARSLQRARC